MENRTPYRYPPMSDPKPLLVVIDPVDTEGHLLHEAAAHARGTGSGLVVLSVMSNADYEARARAINGLRDLDLYYTFDHAAEASRHVALRLAHEVLDDTGIEFTAIGYVGAVEDAVLSASEIFGCESVLIGGHRHGLWDILRRAPDLSTVVERIFPGNVTVFYDHHIGESSAGDPVTEHLTPNAVE